MALQLAAVTVFPQTAYAETGAAAADTSGELSAESEASTEPSEETEENHESFDWPAFPYDLKAVAAIVMDPDTGTVLYGKEIHSRRYPASITKILTALVVIENCSLSEEVEFTEEAVSGLESGAVTINTTEGDVMTVRDCLYALLLKSANEVANALAIHVAGSVPDFCVLMNNKAEELGCLDSDFRNPSGLTDEKHVTSAYDMALIAAACMNNSTFMSLEEKPTRKLPPTKNNPDGLTVTIGHKMLKDSEYYDSRVKAGKTGFTSSAGNTLVTMAEDNGRRLVAVVLKDSNPAHYADTKKLLDFGFDSFENISLAPGKLLKLSDIEKKLIADGIAESGKAELSLQSGITVTVPKGTDTDQLEFSLAYDIPENAPEGTVAYLSVSYPGHSSSGTFVTDSYKEPEISVEPGKDSGDKEEQHSGTAGEEKGGKKEDTAAGIPAAGILIAAAAVLAAAGTVVVIRRKKEETKKALERKQRRLERLQSMNMTEEEFAETVKENREKREKDSGEIT